MGEKLKGSLTISRPRGGSGPEYVEIRLTDEISRTTFIEAQVELAQFTDALVGMAHVPCVFDLDAEQVGKRHEHKTIDVPFEYHGYTKDRDKRQQLAAKAFKSFEVDGWRGRTDDLFNGHNRTNDGYRVTFVRYVPVTE